MDLSELEPAALAERALHDYLALPDANAIARSTCPAASVSGAVQLLQSAKDEAWRIRLEMAQSWDDSTQARVDALLQAKVGKVPHAIRRIHPVTGPLNLARFPNGPLAKMVADTMTMLSEERAQERSDAKRPGAKSTNERKERKWMTECVEGYVKWANENGVPADTKSIENFRELPGKNITRAHELLGILITGLKQNHSNDSILEDLKQLPVRRMEKVWETTKAKQGKRKPEYLFKNPTLDAVADCMQILKKNIVG